MSSSLSLDLPSEPTPSEPPPSETSADLRQQRRTFWLRALGLTLVLRLLLLVLAYATDRVMMQHSAPIWDQLLWNTFKHWDARHYLHLAEYGYASSGEFKVLLAFFPLYPWLVRAMHFLLPHYLLAACLVSWLAAIAAAWLFQDLLRQEGYAPEVIERALFFFVFVPAGIYAALPYTEAVFMLWVLLAFWAARQDRWWLVGLAGLLACLTRANGILLLPAMAVEFWLRLTSETKSPRSWKPWLQSFWLGLIPLGLGGYLLLNLSVTGHPLTFLQIQAEHWHQVRVWPWDQIKFVLGHIVHDPISKSRAIFYEFRLVAIVLSVLFLLGGLKRFRLPWQVYLWNSWLLFMMARQAISFPRYLYMFFPFCVLLALWGKRPLLYQLMLVTVAAIQAGWFMFYAAGLGSL